MKLHKTDVYTLTQNEIDAWKYKSKETNQVAIHRWANAIGFMSGSYEVRIGENTLTIINEQEKQCEVVND